MRRILTLACLSLVSALGLSCVSSTTMSGMWSDPGYTGVREGGRVMVLGIGATEVGTRLFEDTMYDQLGKRELFAVKGSSVFPINAPIDTVVLRGYVEANAIDLLMVTRLVDVSKETQYVRGATAYVPVATYHQWGGYYTASYAVIHEPGYTITSRSAIIETNVYSVESGRLVWSGRSETVDPASLEDAVWDISTTLVSSMAKRGILGSSVEE